MDKETQPEVRMRKVIFFLFIAFFALMSCQCNSKKKHTIRDKSVLSFYNVTINDSLSVSLYDYLYSSIKKKKLPSISNPNFYSIENKPKLSKKAVDILIQFDIINRWSSLDQRQSKEEILYDLVNEAEFYFLGRINISENIEGYAIKVLYVTSSNIVDDKAFLLSFDGNLLKSIVKVYEFSYSPMGSGFSGETCIDSNSILHYNYHSFAYDVVLDSGEAIYEADYFFDKTGYVVECNDDKEVISL